MNTCAPYLLDHECIAGESLNDLLEPTRSVFREVARVVREFGGAIAEFDPQTDATRVQSNLLPRVADDIGAVAVLASLGYEIQAMSLASSAYETAHLAAAIGFDSAHASKWINWTKVEKMPWSIRELTSMAIRNTKKASLDPDKQYYFYQGACLAKHANPLIQASAPFADTEMLRALNADPALTPGAGNRAFAAMFIAAASGILLILAIDAQTPEAIGTETASRCAKLIPRWNAIAKAFKEYQTKRRHDREGA